MEKSRGEKFFEEDKMIFDSWRSVIQHEDIITNQRIGIFLTIQTIIFGGYGVVISKIYEDLRYAHGFRTIPILLSIIGIITSISGNIAFHKTNKNLNIIDKHFRERFPHIRESRKFPELRWEAGAPRSILGEWGPTSILAAMLSIIWILLFAFAWIAHSGYIKWSLW